MKSLTEQQLRDLLKAAWEDGGYTFESCCCHASRPNNPSEPEVKEREELFTKLIASV